MKTRTTIALAAAAVLLSGVTAASAAAMSHASSSSTMARQASDTLSLTSTQRKTAWNDLHSQATKQKAPSGFEGKVGAVVPSTLKIEPVPTRRPTPYPRCGLTTLPWCRARF